MRRVWFLFLSFLPFLTSKSDDHEYYQIRSNKYSLDTLPFSSLTSAIMDQNGHCFVGLSQENIIWTSRENYLINRTIEVLGNLYTPWFKLLDINDIPTEEYQNYLLIKAADTIIILSTSSIVEFSMNYFCNEVVFYEYRYKGDRNSAWGHVFSSTVSLNTLWMGTATGLYKVDMVSSSLWNPQLVESIPISPPVTSLLWVESWSLLFAGTQSVFYEMSTEASGPIYYEWIGGNLDSEVVSMHYDNFQDCLWVAERNAVHKRDANKLWWRYGFKQGAITDNIISIASMYLPSLENEDDFVGYLWIATETHGLTRMTISANDQADRWDTWQLFYGPRYLLGQNISFIVSDTQSTQSSPFLSKFNKREETSSLLVNTNNGLSFLHSEPWSLSKKESLLQSFQYPRHDRNGIVAEVSLDSYGDLTTYYHVPEDSDGIWTSQYAVSAAFRYSLSRNLIDRKSAWRTFEALEILGNITGVEGLIGRSMCSAEEISSPNSRTRSCGTDGENNWHSSSTLPGWVWKGDTSSDTITGHYFAYGVILDHVAHSMEEVSRAIWAIDRITNYIVTNNYYYIDITGEPTKWGRWNPLDINSNSKYYSERGINSLEILSYLALAYSVTGKEIYYQEFNRLGYQEGYIRNLLNFKIDNPFEDNHSDNELGFMAYHTLFYAYNRLYKMNSLIQLTENELKKRQERLKKMITPAISSVQRWWSIVKEERSPLWINILAATTMIDIPDSDLIRTIKSLQYFPLDLINWGYHNTDRWDCVVQPYYGRDDPDDIQMRAILPPQERGISHWNSNPFLFDSSRSSTAYDAAGGYTEYSPAEWLLPYWMMRYYDLL